MFLKFIKLKESAILPEKQHSSDAGVDLSYCGNVPIVIKPESKKVIPTGLGVVLNNDLTFMPDNMSHFFTCEAQIRSRSGIAKNHGVFVLNSPGTIDAGYRGELQIILFNTGKEVFVVNPGMRIAQLVVNIIPKITAIGFTKDWESTDRGSDGFGSTGLGGK